MCRKQPIEGEVLLGPEQPAAPNWVQLDGERRAVTGMVPEPL
jgi:hypothetical protein